MNFNGPWKDEYQKEIEHALQARKSGNEGMARVCARRAAGVIINEYLLRRGYSNLPHSTYDRIIILNDLPDVDPRCRDVAGHFLIKVNPDYKLPMDADLIDEAMWLKKTLLKDHTD